MRGFGFRISDCWSQQPLQAGTSKRTWFIYRASANAQGDKWLISIEERKKKFKQISASLRLCVK